MSGDAALPEPLGLADVRSLRLAAEHTTIELAEPSETPGLGDQLELIVGYSDATVHLHGEIVCPPGGRVEALWRVAARGRIK